METSNEREEPFLVTPYEVRGKVDYEKLLRQFGTKLIDDTLLERIESVLGELHFLLRRRIFFSHRDLDVFLEKVEKGEEVYVYTGRGPSGDMHLGHLIPFLLTKFLQERLGCKVVIQLTDDEKFLVKKKLSLEETGSFARENLKDILALGFDERNLEVIVDTKDITQLYPIALKVAKHLTASTVKATFGFEDSDNVGLFFFTSIQSAPAFIESVRKGRHVFCLIPCAIDQDPHFRLTRDVAPKLGFPKPALIHSKFFPSLLGEGKMSSSAEGSCIFLNDDEEIAKQKIFDAVTGGGGTLKEHREKGGKPEVCSVFKYYEYFFEEGDEKLREIYELCKSGELICGDCKRMLAERVARFLREHKKRREKVNVEKFLTQG